MIRRAAVALLLAVASSRAAPAAERWELEIVGPATVEHGELRFDGVKGQVVLESADSVFLPLAELLRTDSTIRFTITSLHRTFAGSVSDGRMLGTMLDLDGSRFTWNAQRLAPGDRRWPVPPRLTVRQLETGSDLVRVTVPGAWQALLASDARLVAEYDTLARAAGIFPWHGAALQARSTQIQLGIDVPVRESIRRTLETIQANTTDPRFTQIFRGSRGWRLDVNDVALEFAIRSNPSFRLDQAMIPLWRLAPGNSTAPLDSAALREMTWRFWSKYRNDSTLVRGLEALGETEPAGVGDARALLRGYNEAAVWWVDAAQWLMKNRWLDTPQGKRSPEQLVAAFWGDSALRLPEISVRHFGAPEAFPSPSMRPILGRLLKPANAIAADWLASADPDEVLAAWRTLDWGEPFRVYGPGHSRYLTSPAIEARTHVGGLLEMRERILIDAGVPPMLAVATLTHEWQHLILADRRMRGTAPGIRENADEVRLLEDDPWLAEGAAEWATDRILAPSRRQAPLLLAISQSRRLAIRELTSDDPHILGYRLVRAAAEHANNPGLVRERLTRLLHDLAAFARESGLAGKGSRPPMVLVRPFNAAVIPEVTFVLDGGAALDVHRRLRVSLLPVEH